MSSGDTLLERVVREEWGRVVATLMRDVRDLDLAEDAAQEAAAAALASWPRTGVPDRPAAWLLVVARRYAIDRLRRATRYEQKMALLASNRETMIEPPDFDESLVRDDQLALIFGCCHPALDIDSQVALTLRSVCGLTTTEVARAFLVPEPTMAQRVVRAKRKVKLAAVPFTVPDDAQLLERLEAVLTVVYLIFNEGYAATSGDHTIRSDLSNEAIRLARLLCDLMPDDAEVLGLAALLLLTDARRPARLDTDGNLVPLLEQDRTRWQRPYIDEGMALLARASRRADTGPYQLQAAIAAVHDHAAEPDDTNWASIVSLYEMLLALAPTPVVRLNHAVALSMVGDPAAALPLIAASGIDEENYLRLAAEADIHHRLGAETVARALYLGAAAHAPTEPQRRHLAGKAADLA